MSSNCTDRAKEMRDNLVNENKIFLVSGRFCGYCHKAKNLLKAKGIPFHSIDIQSPENSDLNDELIQCFFEKTKSIYIPQVFIEKQYIGGYKNLEEWVTRNY